MRVEYHRVAQLLQMFPQLRNPDLDSGALDRQGEGAIQIREEGIRLAPQRPDPDPALGESAQSFMPACLRPWLNKAFSAFSNNLLWSPPMEIRFGTHEESVPASPNRKFISQLAKTRS